MNQPENNIDSLQKTKRTDPTPEHKGYNEQNPSQPEGAFHPESKQQSGISGKNKKRKTSYTRKETCTNT